MQLRHIFNIETCIFIVSKTSRWAMCIQSSDIFYFQRYISRNLSRQIFPSSEWIHKGLERRKETKKKTSDERIFLILFILTSLLKLLRCFGKYWQYGSKLWKTHIHLRSASVLLLLLFLLLLYLLPFTVAFIVIMLLAVYSHNPFHFHLLTTRQWHNVSRICRIYYLISYRCKIVFVLYFY